MIKSLFVAVTLLVSAKTNVSAAAAAAILPPIVPPIYYYYKPVNQPNPLILNCVYGDPNCRFYSGVMFQNVSGRDIYDTVVWTNGRVIEFTKQGGVYTKEMTVFPGIMEPGYGPNLGVRVIPDATMTPGTYTETLLIGGRLCIKIGINLGCASGADTFKVIVNITNPRPAPTRHPRPAPKPPKNPKPPVRLPHSL